MKKHLLAALLAAASVTCSQSNCEAQGTLIHYWNFNTFTSAIHLPLIASLAADYSIHDTAKARVVFMPIPPGVSSSYGSYADNNSGDTTNARMGAGAGNCFRPRNPMDSMELLFYIPSVHYTHLRLQYATQTSSYTSGDSIQMFAYSLDSGTTWITSGTGLSEWLDSAKLAYSLISVNINDPGASNNPKLVFRITFKGRNSGSSGNNRFDNITLEGDSITSTSVVYPTQAVSSYSLFPNPVTNTLTGDANTTGDKRVTISSIVGQTVYTGTLSGTHFTLNTADLVAGVYYMHIVDVASNEVIIKQFIKQ